MRVNQRRFLSRELISRRDIITMDEVEAATASITQQNSEEETNDLNPVTLEHSAEQILNGIKRDVEVQYLVPMMVASNDHVSQQNQQTTQTELQCPFKESGEGILRFLRKKISIN